VTWPYQRPTGGRNVSTQAAARATSPCVRWRTTTHIRANILTSCRLLYRLVSDTWRPSIGARSCNPIAIQTELAWHGRAGGWRVYLKDLLRAFAYVMALPGVASLTEHYGKDKTEAQLIASTGFATGLTVSIIKTTVRCLIVCVDQNFNRRYDLQSNGAVC
jgi:hypothetical protein